MDDELDNFIKHVKILITDVQKCQQAYRAKSRTNSSIKANKEIPSLPENECLNKSSTAIPTLEENCSPQKSAVDSVPTETPVWNDRAIPLQKPEIPGYQTNSLPCSGDISPLTSCSHNSSRNSSWQHAQSPDGEIFTWPESATNPKKGRVLREGSSASVESFRQSELEIHTHRADEKVPGPSRYPTARQGTSVTVESLRGSESESNIDYVQSPQLAHGSLARCPSARRGTNITLESLQCSESESNIDYVLSPQGSALESNRKSLVGRDSRSVSMDSSFQGSESERNINFNGRKGTQATVETTIFSENGSHSGQRDITDLVESLRSMETEKYGFGRDSCQTMKAQQSADVYNPILSRVHPHTEENHQDDSEPNGAKPIPKDSHHLEKQPACQRRTLEEIWSNESSTSSISADTEDAKNSLPGDQDRDQKQNNSNMNKSLCGSDRQETVVGEISIEKTLICDDLSIGITRSDSSGSLPALQCSDSLAQLITGEKPDSARSTSRSIRSTEPLIPKQESCESFGLLKTSAAKDSKSPNEEWSPHFCGRKPLQSSLRQSHASSKELFVVETKPSFDESGENRARKLLGTVGRASKYTQSLNKLKMHVSQMPDASNSSFGASFDSARSVRSLVSTIIVKVKKQETIKTMDSSNEEDDIEDELYMMDKYEINADEDDRPALMIPGESTGWRLWERWMAIVTASSIVLSTLQTGFGSGTSPLSRACTALLQTTDALFLVDFAVRFLVTYPDPKTQIEVKSFKSIAQHYLRNMFVTQLFAAIPVNLVQNDGKSLMLLLWWLVFLRVPKLLCYLMNDLGFESTLKKMPMWYRAFKMVFIFFLILHLMACSFWAMSEKFNFETEFSPPTDVVAESFAVQYNHAVMKSLLVLSSNDFVVEKHEEQQFMIVGLFVAFLVNGVLIGSFSNLLTEDGTIGERKKQIQGLTNLMTEQRIPRGLRNLIIRYTEYQWDAGHNHYMRSMFDELPAKLKMGAEIQFQKNFVEKTPLIKCLPPIGAISLMQSLTPRIAQPNELIIRQSEVGHSMYFISTGLIRVFLGSDDGGTYLVSLGPGNQFGEISLLKGCRRTSNCLSMQFSDLYELKYSSFNSFCHAYPIFEKLMSSLTQTRLKVSQSIEDQQKLKSKLGLTSNKFNKKRIRDRLSHRAALPHSVRRPSMPSMSHSYTPTQTLGASSSSRRFRLLWHINRLMPRSNKTLAARKGHRHSLTRKTKLRKYKCFINCLKELERMSMCTVDNSTFCTKEAGHVSFFRTIESKMCRLDSNEEKIQVTSLHEKNLSPSFFFDKDEDINPEVLNATLHGNEKLFLERESLKPESPTSPPILRMMSLEDGFSEPDVLSVKRSYQLDQVSDSYLEAVAESELESARTSFVEAKLPNQTEEKIEYW